MMTLYNNAYKNNQIFLVLDMTHLNKWHHMPKCHLMYFIHLIQVDFVDKLILSKMRSQTKCKKNRENLMLTSSGEIPIVIYFIFLDILIHRCQPLIFDLKRKSLKNNNRLSSKI